MRKWMLLVALEIAGAATCSKGGQIESMSKVRAVRLAAFVIDHAIFSFLAAIAAMPVQLYSFRSNMSWNELLRIQFFIVGAIFLLFTCKDLWRGQSVGKRLLKLEVVSANRHSHRLPALWRLWLRNVTLLIWPIEIIVLLASGRRIGDRIAGTQVILTDPPPIVRVGAK